MINDPTEQDMWDFYIQAIQGDESALFEMLIYCDSYVELLKKERSRKKTGKASRDPIVLFHVYKVTKKMKEIDWHTLAGKVALSMELSGEDMSVQAIRKILKRRRLQIELGHASYHGGREAAKALLNKRKY